MHVSAMAEVLPPITPKTTPVNSRYNRLLVTYRRVVRPRRDGSHPDGSQPEDLACSVPESINLVHPDDERDEAPGRRASQWNAFRELGDMFRGNSSYYDVRYVRYPASEV